jgi:hypothetical protein
MELDTHRRQDDAIATQPRLAYEAPLLVDLDTSSTEVAINLRIADFLLFPDS